MSRRGWFGRMGLQRDLIRQCGRIGLMVFFCLERDTSDTRVLRRVLGVVVASIWRFGRSGSLSSNAPKFVECFNGFVSHGPCGALPHDSFALVIFNEYKINGSRI